MPLALVSEPDYAQAYHLASSMTYYWDVGTLSWVKGTQPTGGGSGGAVTIADGANVAQGTTTDVAWVSGAGTEIAVLKKIAGGIGGLTDTQLRASAVPVSGTFFQGTQPVSGTVAVTSAGLTNLDVALSTRLKPADTLAAVTSITNPISSKIDLTPSSPTAATVGVASAQALAANANRKGLALVNVSTARVSLGFGAAAVLDNGVTLYPGGVFTMDEYFFDLGVVNAIASAAASQLAIQELTT